MVGDQRLPNPEETKPTTNVVANLPLGEARSFQEALGRLFRAARGDEKQETMAKVLGVRRSSLSNIEGGTTAPSLALTEKLSELVPDLAGDISEAYAGLAAARRNASNRRNRGSRSTDPDMRFFSRDSPPLAGTWYALWQTSVNWEQNLNFETLTFSWKGDQLVIANHDVSQDNPKGGYLWSSDCRLLNHRYLVGWYTARDPNVMSCGVLYCVVNPSGKSLVGHWVGCNIDSDWSHGLVAISRDQDDLAVMLKRHISALPPMPYWPSPELR